MKTKKAKAIKTIKAVTVDELPDQSGVPGPCAILVCANAHEFSANRPDYFMLRPKTKMICRCGEPLRLMFKRTVYVAA